MSLYLLGINHHTAPVELREHLAFDPATLPATLTGLAAVPGVKEAAILSTCNRTELYTVVEDNGAAGVRAWLLDKGLQSADLEGCLYEHHQGAVIHHACRVAAGLDSAVLGEPQILGQIKDAYRLSQAQLTTGPTLNRLFQHVFTVAKKVRSNTAIGQSFVSAASATVNLARQVYAGFEQRTALFIGAGEMIELTMRHFASNGLGRAIIANRSPVHARRLARRFNALVVALDQMPSHLHTADLVISCTASPDRMIDVEQVKAALKLRKRRPMLLVDLAVPRDIDPRVAQLADAYLYTVDDLRAVIDTNQAVRVEAAAEADALIEAATAQFLRREDALDAVPLIKSVRSQLNTVRDQAVAHAQRQIAAGKPVDKVLERLADAITQRLLHEPSARMREAGEQGDRELLDVASRLFGIGKEK